MKQKRLTHCLLVGMILCGLATAQADQDVLVIRAHRVWTMTQDVIEDGMVIIRKGKIEAVGNDLTLPDGAKILEMPQGHVMPGLIDAHSHLGLVSDALAEMDEAVFASSADTQVLDAFDPATETFQRALHAGVTCGLIAPGNRNPIAGQTAVAKFCGGPQGAWLLKRDAGLKFSMTHDTLQYDRRPTSWPGLITFVREQLDLARQFEGDRFDPQASVLKRVVNRDIRVFVAANTPEEVRAALDLIKTYGLDGCIIGARQGDEVAEPLAEQAVPVAMAPVVRLNKDRDLKRAGQLAAAGVKLAFASDSPATAPSDLRTSAIYAVKFGLDRDLALKGLTLYAAQMLGVADRVGSIQAGKDADLIILGGDPMALTSGVQVVIINGEIVFQREAK
ncbi:MAG: amidohydrolase family protein [Planctomycetes bacterium]|nr:amidohydrolase family protein [Planctomycetota bacterium]